MIAKKLEALQEDVLAVRDEECGQLAGDDQTKRLAVGVELLALLQRLVQRARVSLQQSAIREPVALRQELRVDEALRIVERARRLGLVPDDGEAGA